MVTAVEEGERIAPDGAPPTMGVLEAIRTRRSVGRVRPERPSKEAIERLLEAATWAPNHRLTEPWRFFVLAGAAREELGEVMARSQAAVLAAAGADGPDARTALEKTRAKPLRAPVIVAVAVVPDGRPKTVEIEEVAAGAAAVQNMLLAAHGLGLAAIWRTGEPAYDPAVKAFFGLPPAAHLLGFVYVGFPDMAAPRQRRKPAAEATRWLGWEDGAGAVGA